MTRQHFDFLVCKTAMGDSQLCTPGELAVQVLGASASGIAPEVLQEAATAVLYYFKHEAGREVISALEFGQALAEVLRKFGVSLTGKSGREWRTDLRSLAAEAGKGCELFFFTRLRRVLEQEVHRGRRLVRFTGLRGCVKQMLGTRRWTPACQQLSEQVVAHLRQSFSCAVHSEGCRMVVE